MFTEDNFEKIQYDLFYVKNRSFFLDLGILLKTINIILKGGGDKKLKAQCRTMTFEPKKIFITGGAGFIGYFITKELIKQGHKVVIYDAFLNFIPTQESNYSFYLKERLKDIQSSAQIIKGDLRDKEYLKKTLKEEGPDIIIHLAGIPLATASSQFFDDAIQSNLNGTINLLEAIRECPSVKRIVYASSSFVYGDFDYEPANEEHPTRPIDIYGATKLSGEIMTKTFTHKFGIEYVIIRPSAVYGPTDANKRVSQMFIENAIKGIPLVLHDNGEGKIDFTYVEDAAQGFILAAFTPGAKNEIFNITRGEGRKIKEFVEILQTLISGIKTVIKPTDERRPNRGSLDISKAKTLLGYNPKYPLEEGLKKYIEYIKSTGLFKNYNF